MWRVLIASLALVVLFAAPAQADGGRDVTVLAIALLEDAGYDDGFVNVTLRDPLGPDPTPPLYIFGTDNGFVAVNTKTGDVEPIE